MAGGLTLVLEIFCAIVSPLIITKPVLDFDRQTDMEPWLAGIFCLQACKVICHEVAACW